MDAKFLQHLTARVYTSSTKRDRPLTMTSELTRQFRDVELQVRFRFSAGGQLCPNKGTTGHQALVHNLQGGGKRM